MTAKRLLDKPADAVDLNDERKRAQIPVRTSAALRERLRVDAAANDRSLTEEIERRLNLSFQFEDELGGAHTAQFFRSAAVGMRQVEERTGKRWTEDTETWRAVQVLIDRHIRNWRPTPPDHQKIAEAAKAVDAAKIKYVAAGEAYGSQFPRSAEERSSAPSFNALMPNRPALSPADSDWRFPSEAKSEEERAQMEAAWALIEEAHEELKQAKQALEDAFAAHDAADEKGRDLGTAMVVALDLVAKREA
jgi:hypothetical protein